MIKKLRNAIIALVSVATLMAPAVLLPATVGALDQVQNGLCQGTNLSVDINNTTTPCDTQSTQGTSTNDRVNRVITLVINILSLIVGVVAVIMIIVGGLKYVLSSGDSGNVTGAKNTIIFAIVGLVIVALAQFIVRFVLAKVTQ